MNSFNEKGEEGNNTELNEKRRGSLIQESSESYEHELRRRILEFTHSGDDSEDIEWGDLFLK